MPTIACSGTPPWRARVPISPDDLALQRLLVELALAGDARHARRAHARVEVQRVEHERRARLEHGAERRPQPAGEPAGGAGHRHAARVARAARARQRVAAARSSRSTIAGVGALLRAEDRRRALERRAHVAQHDEPRAAQPAALLDRLDRARAAVRGRRCRRRPTSTTCAPASTAAAISSPVPGVDAAHGVALVLGDEAQPARRRHLDDRRAAVLEQPEAGVDLAPERVVHARARGLAAERGQQHLQRALAAVGDRAQVRRHQPGALEAAAHRRRPPRWRGTCP